MTVTDRASMAPGPAAVRGTIRRHPLATFFALCFAITWGLGLVIVAHGRGLVPVAVPYAPLFYLGVYAPTIAALVVGAAADGTAGARATLAGWTRWRSRAVWYLVALALFPVLGLLAGLLHAAGAGGRAALVPAPAAIAAVLLVGATFGPVGEQAGWRGFALPRLQDRHGPLLASLLLGTIWGAWHGILWLIPGAGQAAYPFPLFVLATAVLQLIFTWLSNETAGSLPVLACLHYSVNTTLTLNGLLGAVPPVAFLLLTVALLGAVALAILAATRGRLAYRPAQSPPPAQPAGREAVAGAGRAA